MKYEDINWFDLNVHQSNPCLPKEVWKYSDMINNLLNKDTKFYVSNYGRVKRSDTDYVYKITDNGSGYKKAALTNKEGKTKNFYIHRVVASAFIPNPDNLPQVNHKRTGLGKFDNRVIHLEWCSEKDNILDAHDNGQMDNRTKVNTSIDRKSESFIRSMYTRYKESGKISETAREFGVSRTTLSSIVNKRSRRNITDQIDKEFET